MVKVKFGAKERVSGGDLRSLREDEKAS